MKDRTDDRTRLEGADTRAQPEHTLHLQPEGSSAPVEPTLQLAGSEAAITPATLATSREADPAASEPVEATLLLSSPTPPLGEEHPHEPTVALPADALGEAPSPVVQAPTPASEAPVAQSRPAEAVELREHEAEAQPSELRVGDVVDGRYRITRRLGRGGMGTVYEAQQIKLQRLVALKVLRPELAGHELAAKRFEREARAASSIDHRNVVKILDFGQLHGGELYYTMELLQGRDLSHLLREHGALPWSRAGWIVLQVVRAFAAVHDKGIVHRDIKPANCFLLAPKPGDEPDLVKILDFGIANLQDPTKATALTAASDIIGSVHYMAPEQAASDHVDARTDVYSLGIMMYELVTGQVPFRATNLFKVMQQHQQEPPRPPRELVPQLPPEVEAIILRAIAKAPGDRFQSMVEVEDALLPWVDAPGSGVLHRTSPTGSGSGSALALTLPTAPGSPGPLAASTPFATTTSADPGADTSPRIGDALAPTAVRPQSAPRRLVVPLVVATVAFAGILGAFSWLGRGAEGDGVVSTPALVELEAQPPQTEVEPTVQPDQLVPPPPEQQYDPFADPFGAPPLRAEPASRARSRGTEATRTDADAPPTTVALDELLPPEPWMLAPGSIAGRLLAERERPLPNARVCAWMVDPRAPIDVRRRPRCTEADRQGRFELREVPPGFYDVHGFARGFLPQSLLAGDGQPLAVRPGARSEGLELALAAGGVDVRGTVKASTGEPIASASVAAVGSARALAVTDAAGEFTLWAADGELGVVAWAAGYSDVVVRGSASEPFALVLRRESILDGRVVDADTGKPIAKARVRAGVEGAGVDPLVYSDAEGKFHIPALAAGTYQPSARTDDAFGRVEEAVELLEGRVSAAVVIAVRRQVAAPPEPPAAVAELADVVAGDGGSPGIVAEDAPPKPPVEPPPAPTNASLRKAFKDKLKKCGKDLDGTIEITAKFVLQDGTLYKPKAEVTGAAASDPRVKECALERANALRLLRRPNPTDFAQLVVPL